jgi:DNA-binding GntR family transcriptional regulator
MARPPRASIQLPAIGESSSLPYLAVRDYIAARISDGEFAMGSKLPSERQLQEALERNRGTIRDALLQLEGEGLIYRQSRSGWYVSGRRVRYDPTRPAGFMTYVAAQGRVPATQTLSVEVVPASSWIAECLAIKPGKASYFIRRMRSVDQRPVLVEHLYVNPTLLPGLIEHSLDGSMTELIRREYGITVARMEIDMSPCLLPETQAQALRVAPGTPGLYLTRRSLDADERVVEYNQEYWMHDIIDVHVDIAFGKTNAGATRKKASR